MFTAWTPATAATRAAYFEKQIISTGMKERRSLSDRGYRRTAQPGCDTRIRKSSGGYRGVIDHGGDFEVDQFALQSLHASRELVPASVS